MSCTCIQDIFICTPYRLVSISVEYTCKSLAVEYRSNWCMWYHCSCLKFEGGKQYLRWKFSILINFITVNPLPGVIRPRPLPLPYPLSPWQPALRSTPTSPPHSSPPSPSPSTATPSKWPSCVTPSPSVPETGVKVQSSEVIRLSPVAPIATTSKSCWSCVWRMQDWCWKSWDSLQCKLRWVIPNP